MTMVHKLPEAEILPFITGGKAVFTVLNAATGNRGTFRIETTPTGFIVRTLTGSDNASLSSYSCLGNIVGGKFFLRTDQEVWQELKEKVPEGTWLDGFLELWASFRNQGKKPSPKMVKRWGIICRKYGVEPSPVLDSKQEVIFLWTWNRLQAKLPLPGSIEVWHEGLCAHCARLLTVPASIQLGLGPDCAEQKGLLKEWQVLNAVKP